MSTSNSTYLVTGGNRGIGLKFVETLAALPNTTVIATTRSESAELNAVASEHKNVNVLRLTVDDEKSVKAFGVALSGIPNLKIDYFISNAGYADSFSSVADASREKFIKHFMINDLGPIEVYKAILPYLSDASKLVFVSSIVASISLFDTIPFTTSAYGASKAFLNYIAKEIAIERKDKSISISIHPGAVSTDMNKIAMSTVADRLPTITPRESVAAQLKVIENLTQEDSGKFFSYDGSTIPF